MQQQPEKNFQNISNFRDVGQSINQQEGHTILRPGRLFRSARPDKATLHDGDRLRDYYGVKTIIDLRTTTELINAVNEAHIDGGQTQATADRSSNQALLNVLKLRDIDYTSINLNGRGFERSLIWHLSYWSLIRVIVFMLFGYRLQAVKIMATEVLQPRGLAGLAIDTLDHSQPEIKELFDTLGDATQWPVVIHCTQGKDRTGLATILLLLLCDIDIAAITADYVVSEKGLEHMNEERLKEIHSIGLDDSFAKCPSDLPQRVQKHIVGQHGSVRQYLQNIGVSDEVLQTIRRILLA